MIADSQVWPTVSDSWGDADNALRVAIATSNESLVSLLLSHTWAEKIGMATRCTWQPKGTRTREWTKQRPRGCWCASERTLLRGTKKAKHHCMSQLRPTRSFSWDFGADPSARDDNGRTPLECAEARGDLELVSVLWKSWRSYAQCPSDQAIRAQ